ncbi:hypothetical protein KA089_00965 [Candidatus Woesebacteria bacterium]|nr:hypothetical protein [Candidatus Woesebacteria bacterium]
MIKETIVVDSIWISKKDNESRYVFDLKYLDQLNTSQEKHSDALHKLSAQALKVVELPNSDLNLLIFEKVTPYSSQTPFDLMFLVISKNYDRKVSGIADLAPPELADALSNAKTLIDNLSAAAQSSGKNIVKKSISVNYHENPLPEENVFFKKKHMLRQ